MTTMKWQTTIPTREQIEAHRDLAQRNAATASALRSALPGEQVAEELRALRALIVKGGAQ